MNRYLKFASEVAATVLAAVLAALTGDGRVEASEWVNVVVLGLGAFAVLGAGNLPEGVWKYAKSLVAAATAVAVLLQSFITDGVNSTEMIQLVLAALGALGVFAVKGPVVTEARGGHTGYQNAR